MNIVYSSSDSYSEICGISIVSLFENNKDAEKIIVYIIDNNISDKNKERLISTGECYGRTIIFVNKLDIERLANTNIYTEGWNISTFFRLYMASILPESVYRVIYIDCDTIVRHSLKSVYEIDIGENLVAAVDDCRGDLYREELGCKPGSVYANNGFMIVDLNKWRNLHIENEFTKFISERHGNLTYMDQAPLNGVLGAKELIYELPPIYNAQRIFFDFSYHQLLKLRKPTHYPKIEEYNQATQDPTVVHFTPTFLTGTRPWIQGDKHPFTKEFLYYKSISEWKNEELRRDERKTIKKATTKICQMMPKKILIPIVSYLHTTWYPKKRIKLSKSYENLNNK